MTTLRESQTLADELAASIRSRERDEIIETLMRKAESLNAAGKSLLARGDRNAAENQMDLANGLLQAVRIIKERRGK